MSNFQELGVLFKRPMTQSGEIDLNGTSVIISNTGDDTVFLNRMYRLLPGQSLEISSEKDLNVVRVTFFVTFEGLGTDPYLQFLELRPVLEGGYSNFIGKTTAK